MASQCVAHLLDCVAFYTWYVPQKIYKACEVKGTAIITGLLLKAKRSYRVSLLL